jgi:hypothetical protein
VATPLLRRFKRGVDALPFAYGATSAGKTFTVQGRPDEPGLIPRMLRILLIETERGFLGACVEVYNERLIDFLGETNKTLRIGKDEIGLTTVKSLDEIEVKTEADVTQMLKDIEMARRQYRTRLNAVSDIASCNINKSMLVLGRCIREIRKASRGGAAQVPYRESKLTEQFRDFHLLVNISPSTAQFDDTLFSLQFTAEAAECNFRTGDPSDVDFHDGEDSDARTLAETEARIRREIHEETSERLRKIQSDSQLQVEQILSKSTQLSHSKRWHKECKKRCSLS